MIDIIIENLISNAVKYSNPSDQITVQIHQKDKILVYEIHDSGIGIAADEIDKIKEPFYRSNPLDHPDVKGNGLGLSIVKRMCELLHVGFNIKSELGQGTVVVLTFES